MFVLLKTPEDWHTHMQCLAEQHRLPGGYAFGAGPQGFPCLVTTKLTAMGALSCYVYPADAARLLAVTPAEAAQSAGPTQTDHYRSTSAHVLAIVWFLKETGIAKSEQQYFDKYVEMLGKVDRWTADDRDQLSRLEQSLA